MTRPGSGLGADVTVERLAVDPYAVGAALREAEPVTYAPHLGMWLVADRQLIRQVLRDAETFSSDDERSPIKATFGPQMLNLEGADHKRHRDACAPPFRPRRVEERWRTLVEGHCSRLLEGIAAEAGPDAVACADLRARLARPLVVSTIIDVMGLPVHDVDKVATWYDDFAASLADYGGDTAAARAGAASARAFGEVVRPTQLPGATPPPEGSLLFDLASADPRPLDPDEVVSNALVCLFGAIETTESTISNALWGLLTNPDQLAILQADRSLIPPAVEETLRWEPAVQLLTRYVTTDVELGGVRIPPGAVLQCLVGSANRDPAAYPEPDRFDITRKDPEAHLAFGYSTHFCVGAELARLETRVVLEQMLERFDELRLDEERRTPPYGQEFRKPPTLWTYLRRAPGFNDGDS